jgi:hypothetical protein
MTTSDGKPIVHAPIVFTCHIAAGIACRLSQDGNTTDTITIIANESGLAQINAGDGVYVSIPNNQPVSGPVCGGPYSSHGARSFSFTVTAVYGKTSANITSVTFPESICFPYPPASAAGSESSAG